MNDVYLKLVLVDTEDGRVRVIELLQELFQVREDEIQRLLIRRLEMYGRCGKEWLNPLESENIWQAR